MESHSEEAPRKAGLFQGGNEMKNPTSGTPTGLPFFKPQGAHTYPMGSYPDSNSYFYFFKPCTTPFTVKIAFLFLVTTVLFIRPGCIAITCE